MSDWITNLRTVIKDENGPGWTVREARGKTQITHRYWSEKDQSKIREFFSVDIPWTKTNQTEITRAVKKIHDRLSAQKNRTLREAGASFAASNPNATNQKASQNSWEQLIERFLSEETKGLSPSTIEGKRQRLNCLKEVLLAKPYPRSGGTIFEKYAEKFFTETYPPGHKRAGELVLPVGDDGRRRRLGVCSNFLEWAVDAKLIDDRFMPPSKKKIDSIIGISDLTSEERLTEPIREQQLAALLDQMEKDGKHELRLACGLCAFFALRPAELAAIKVENGKLFVVRQIKRNVKTKNKKPTTKRQVFPLDLPATCGSKWTGEGDRLARVYESGLVKLPESLRNQIAALGKKGVTGKAKKTTTFKEIGKELAKLLERYKPWQELTKQYPDISAYSLRHSYSWRSHQGQHRLSPQEAAHQMRHSLQTHLKYYSAFMEDQRAEKSIAEFNKAQAELREGV